MATDSWKNLPKLHDRYESIAVFEELLEDARMNADSDWAESFVAQISEKYKAHGGGMFWSSRQDEVLRKIAGNDE